MHCSGFLLTIVLIPALGSTVKAQIAPDGTLRNNSAVNQVGSQWNITKGETVGNNLFHSFSIFNVGTGETAFFNNVTTLQNIIARVTGGTSSTIDGIIRANGGANLFLINPSGIIFGSNAQLNMGGSFFASTAESVVFSDSSSFSATNPQAPPLLAVNVPMGLQMSSNPGNIAVNAQNLQVFSGRTIGFIGGNLQLTNAKVQASQGRIELGSVSANSFVRLTPNNANIVVSYEGLSNFRDIQLSNATVDASGLGGGIIQVQGRNVVIGNGSQVLSRTLGSQAGGDITLRGSELVSITGTDSSRFTVVSSDTVGSGGGGDLRVETGLFQLQGTAFLSSSSLGSGAGGDLIIRATEGVVVSGNSQQLQQIFTDAFSGQLTPTNRLGGLFSVVAGTVPGGDITIEAGWVSFQDGAIALTSTFGQAPSGNINIQATGAVDINNSGIVSATNLGTQGAAGDININARQLTIRDGSALVAGTLGDGQGGDITLETADFVEISQTLPRATGIITNTLGQGEGGDIRIATGRLRVRDALISTSSGGTTPMGIFPFGGIGGDITVDARESVEITGSHAIRFSGGSVAVLPSGFSTTTFTPSPAGNLTLRTPQLTLDDGATLDVRSLGSGNAGTLDIAANSIVLDRGSSFNASTITGAEGNINLNANLILLRRGSNITTDAGNTDGGNIFINANNIVAVLTEDSDISANSRNSRGGNITINVSGGIFGLRFQPQDTPFSDITATGRNSALSGTVTINTVAVNPTAGLEKLAQDIADPSNQIATGCTSYAQSRLTVLGRGGLPDNPIVRLPGQTVWRDMQAFSSRATRNEASISPQEVPTSRPLLLIEANSWRVNKAGNVELIALLPQVATNAENYNCKF
ncbi:filamentous hemagglutinin N-terminal domain-containing protein [Lusitaniella coriacea LEGE 07157]|uniref:Filamentous hemagglutinin N-terminal domain-containing protein n=1 Tax=Lusitaniella coriacea LEGE 07157 TaxID=945747 RepID=A0A8J7AX19_9CYAN|nr:filamentous hemagglutinin N-terminal domain-containing protein [Lusitaniella coriacea]MBE9115107.1 filamentous hemagglutinin N-terminal domain-containing protein [Lusitaniella coriacea LEGE 07157]